MRGVITSDMLEDTLERGGSLESITSCWERDYSSALAGMSGIPINIWINDAGLPVKYVFDMTGMTRFSATRTARTGRRRRDRSGHVHGGAGLQRCGCHCRASGGC